MLVKFKHDHLQNKEGDVVNVSDAQGNYFSMTGTAEILKEAQPVTAEYKEDGKPSMTEKPLKDESGESAIEPVKKSDVSTQVADTGEKSYEEKEKLTEPVKPPAKTAAKTVTTGKNAK